MNTTSGRLEVHLPVSTIFRVLLTALAVGCLIKLWPEVVFLLLSLVLAVAVEPTVAWAERARVPRGIAVSVLALTLLAVLCVVVTLATPPLVVQLGSLVDHLPALRDRILALLPASSSLGRDAEQLWLPSAQNVAPYVAQTFLVGVTTLSGLATTFLVIVTTLYLLLDGKRLYAWLLAYVPRKHRLRVAETIPEVSRVVTAYVRGQMLLSLLFGLFAAILLHLCHVPAVLPLAFFAAVCDVVPVVGIFMATVPAALLGLTVSPLTAGMIIVGYLLYHLIEAYVLLPRVYGSTLRISTIGVLLALIIGVTLQGLLGAVLILPIVAAYPIIERIWLKNYLAAEVLQDHRALENGAAAGNDDAIKAVLQGVEHPGEQSSRSPEA